MADKNWTGKKPVGVEKTVDVLSQLSWTVQPPLGLIKGSYYCVDSYFAKHHALDDGYHGILEAVVNDGKLVHIEFNEDCSASYYKRYFQGASKRRSDYCFFQATKERTAQTLKVLDNGFTALEQQMLRENRLVGDFDLVTGASNSCKRAFLPLASQINGLLSQPNAKMYYGLARKQDNGITPRLQVVIENGRIIKCFYDEIFADTQEEISDESMKKYYRQSKYNCITYESHFPDGFNVLSDLLQQHVLVTQNLLDVSGLPWTVDTEARKHAELYETYLSMAKEILDEAKKDGVL